MTITALALQVHYRVADSTKGSKFSRLFRHFLAALSCKTRHKRSTNENRGSIKRTSWFNIFHILAPSGNGVPGHYTLSFIISGKYKSRVHCFNTYFIIFFLRQLPMLRHPQKVQNTKHNHFFLLSLAAKTSIGVRSFSLYEAVCWWEEKLNHGNSLYIEILIFDS